MIYDCSMSCVSETTASYYTGDGTCDDGTWGYDLECAEFSYDDGDCDGSSGGGSTGVGASCGSGMVYDCSMTCVSETTASYYTGDGTCDDGTYGYDLTCAEFSYDDGDCDGSSGGGSGSAGIGDSCGSGLIYDCAMDCVSSSTAYSYMGDGSCDDGTWGYDLTCAEFSYDEGDCDGSGGGSSGGGIGDSCGAGMVYDCAMTCVSETTAEYYTGDGTCDDGSYGYDLTCAEFSYDDFDCFI